MIVQATSEGVRKESHEDINTFLDLLKSREGYDVKEERPLEILSNNGKIRVILELRNIAAQMFRGEVVR